MRMFGWVDKVDDTCVVATEFIHVAGVPLWPTTSHLIDTTTMVTNREVEEQVLSTEYREITSFKSIPLGSDRRSIAAGYLRTWGVIAAMFGGATATQATAFIYIGAALIAAGVMSRKFSFLRLADQLVLTGVGAMAGAVGGYWVSRPIAGAIAILGVGAVVLTMTWRRATAERARWLGKLLGLPPDVIDMRHTLTARAANQATPAPTEIPRAQARAVARPSAPVVPIASTAPERIEQAADAPRFLGPKD